MKKQIFAMFATVAGLCWWLEALAAEPVPLPAKNLGFRQWDAGGKPEGWALGPAPGFKLSRECPADGAAACVLGVQSTEAYKSGVFLPLAQRLAPGAAAGHTLTLSGLIRTENVAQGGAALWLRVDGSAGSLALDNMGARQPRGTTGWSRFEVMVPVAGNARSIVFGVMLTGSGSAWFDDLKLLVDTTAAVPDAVITELKVPPRPAPSQALLDDAALRIAAADIPAANPAWRDDVLARRHPLRSLFSDDFSDLQFLKPLLAGKRVVQLGESGHGVAEFSLAKVRLIKFLHQQMGFDVIAFESSLPQCYDADQVIGSIAPADAMRRCIFRVWHTDEVLGLFDYLDASRKAGARLNLAGFDIQDSAPDSARSNAVRFERMRGLLGLPVSADLAASEQLLAQHYGKDPIPADASARLVKFYGDLVALLDANRAPLLAAGVSRDDAELAIQAAASRVRLTQQLSGGRDAGRFEARDAGMADNLDFLLDTLYPKRKVIVWAHNAHVAYQRPGFEARPMGSFVAARRKPEVYTIGLYMGRGVAAGNARDRYPIAAPGADTFEGVLANGRVQYTYVDFGSAQRSAATAWIFAPLASREWGTRPATITPADSYDAVLYIDTVTPPAYR